MFRNKELNSKTKKYQKNWYRDRNIDLLPRLCFKMSFLTKYMYINLNDIAKTSKSSLLFDKLSYSINLYEVSSDFSCEQKDALFKENNNQLYRVKLINKNKTYMKKNNINIENIFNYNQDFFSKILFEPSSYGKYYLIEV